MPAVLEAVPNFSEGRDLPKVRSLVELIGAVRGVEVLDWSADPDHNRCVVTFVGAPAAVEEASVAAAAYALEHIDLRRHVGVHPRIGALDVLPFVPLHGMTMAQAVESARRVGSALAGLGIPVFHYGFAADPPGRGLAELRRGGFEALEEGFPADRRPDHAPSQSDGARPHPTAGATCVGARWVLLAWNVFVAGVSLEAVKRIATRIRETGGGFPGVRALGFHLEEQDRLQLSMNLEDPDRTNPMEVFRAIEAALAQEGGHVVETEVIGMIPDALVLPAAGGRLNLSALSPPRLLSHRVLRHRLARAEEESEALRRVLVTHGEAVPAEVRDAAFRLLETPLGTTDRDSDR